MKIMKNIFLIGLMAVVVCSLVACSSDDDDVALVPQVDVLENISYNPTELDAEGFLVTTIKFSSNANWRIYSDKMWVLFSQTENGNFYNDLKGVAGTHTVYVKIINSGSTFETSSADVKVACEGSEFVLSTIEREAKERVTQIVDKEGTVVNSLDFGNESSIFVKIDANYNVGIKYYPSWMEEPTLYDGGYILSIKDEFTPYALSDKFVIASVEGDVEQEYATNYLGLSPSYMNISGDYASYGWEIHTDGTTFQYESSLEGDTEKKTVNNNVPFNFKCLNYDCKFVVVNEEKNGLISLAETPWIMAEISSDDKTKILVTATEFTPSKAARSRQAIVYAVPAGVYDDFVTSINAISNADDAEAFMTNHSEYVVIKAIQKDLYASEGFAIAIKDGASVACTKLNSSNEYYEWIKSEFSVDEVYAMTGDAKTKYVLNTLYTDDEGSVGYGIFENLGGAIWERVNGALWGKPKIYEGDDDFYRVEFKIPNAGVSNITVFVVSINGLNKKALIIMSANN